MSDSITRQAARETAAIAAGLSRAEAEQRARRAFESANDIRARLRGLPDTAKRAHAVSRARAWAEILQHMDSTGEPQFCGRTHDSTPPAVARAAWAAWDWLTGLARLLNAITWARALRDLLGTEPVTFYQQTPGQRPAARPASNGNSHDGSNGYQAPGPPHSAPGAESPHPGHGGN